MAKSDYGRDMYRQLTEVMARLERVEEKSQESEKKHETEIRDLKATQKEEIRRIREEHRKEKETLERDNRIKRREYEAKSRSSPIEEQ